MNEPTEAVALIVKELGAYWPTWASELQKEALNSVVEVQGYEELAADFAQRVAKRAAALEKNPIRTAVLLCADTSHGSTLDARCWLARVIVGVLGADGYGAIVLAGAPDASATARTELFELAGVLCEELYGRDISVRVKFSANADSSGFHAPILAPAAIVTPAPAPARQKLVSTV